MGVSQQAYVAVVGAADATPEELRLAGEVGRLLGEDGAVMICGGLGGVMDEAARACEAAGGTSVGILPGDDRAPASRHLTVAIATGIGEARNAIVVRSADVVIAVGGEYGTLSEIAFALKMGKPVIGLATWELSREGMPDPILRTDSPIEAVARALALARS
ncbi:MAG: TIGR00725 family protein [Actinomycetota bacterium]|nr:TIGR00725 family protein [Actinomycetota bacterium]